MRGETVAFDGSTVLDLMAEGEMTSVGRSTELDPTAGGLTLAVGSPELDPIAGPSFFFFFCGGALKLPSIHLGRSRELALAIFSSEVNSPIITKVG